MGKSSPGDTFNGGTQPVARADARFRSDCRALIDGPAAASLLEPALAAFQHRIARAASSIVGDDPGRQSRRVLRMRDRGVRPVARALAKVNAQLRRKLGKDKVK